MLWLLSHLCLAAPKFLVVLGFCVMCSRSPAGTPASRLRGPDVVVRGAAAAAAVAADGARHVRRLVQAAQRAAALLLLQSVRNDTVTFEVQVMWISWRLGQITCSRARGSHSLEGCSNPAQYFRCT